VRRQVQQLRRAPDPQRRRRQGLLQRRLRLTDADADAAGR
jgi:hypothetical protein